MIDEAVLEHARDNLKRRTAALNDVRIAKVVQRDFTFKEIKNGLARGGLNDWIRPLLGQHQRSAAIYRLTVNDQDGANRLRQAFLDRGSQNGNVFARNNNVADSTTVYVGSSQKVGQRLQQHLLTGPIGTYALKMHLWCPYADNFLSVEISVLQGTAEPSLLQDVEDALWITSRPMFGKFGAR
ncbi:hypothetical protein [Sulfitobacter sp. M22]|uniref:hypothetical protein n=1 Tax=Sulfitobacter sp. M22 TaxID=2675332 RepID=UPI001F25D032|nr:hypothetical protein [Sulfitobacter sp. M22]MCF7728064.1 hypothetical protein [Sulfitobacter sp. M22]